jgi:hypothetical protein
MVEFVIGAAIGFALGISATLALLNAGVRRGVINEPRILRPGYQPETGHGPNPHRHGERW